MVGHLFYFDHDDVAALIFLGLDFVTDLVLLVHVIHFIAIFALGLVHPCVETDAIVHHCQEGVYGLPFVYYFVVDFLPVYLVVDFTHLCFQRNARYFEQRPQLNNLHLLIQLEVAVHPPHASIQQLIEINPTVFTPDAHLKNSFLGLTVR